MFLVTVVRVLNEVARVLLGGFYGVVVCCQGIVMQFGFYG